MGVMGLKGLQESLGLMALGTNPEGAQMVVEEEQGKVGEQVGTLGPLPG